MSALARAMLALAWGCSLDACVTQVELARNAPDELWVIGKVPEDALSRFASESVGEPDARLSVSYPETSSEIPANLGALRVTWELMDKAEPGKPMPMAMAKAKGPPEAGTYFELCLRGGHTLCVYTDGSQVDIDAARLAPLVGSELPSQLTLQLRALLRPGNRVIVAPETALTVRAALASGALYYQEREQLRSATASSVMAEELGAVVNPESARFVISRDGRRMATMPSPEELQLLSLPDRSLVWSIAAPLSGPGEAFLAFDPLAQRLAFARGGQLSILGIEDGSVLSSFDGADGTRISHPDWSPDGTHLAVALWPADAKPEVAELEGSSVARLSVSLQSTLGTPEVLVSASKSDETLCFPAYSRDGGELAYLQFKGKLRDAKDGALMVTSAEGGPARLVVIDGMPMKPAEKALKLAAASPTWWPDDHGDEWLTVAAEGALTGKELQLYVLPVNKLALVQGAPAEAHGIWLPFQNPMAPSTWPAFVPD